MRRRGAALHRGVVAFAAPIQLGNRPSWTFHFSAVNFCIGFCCAIAYIWWLLYPYSDEVDLLLDTFDSHDRPAASVQAGHVVPGTTP